MYFCSPTHTVDASLSSSLPVSTPSPTVFSRSALLNQLDTEDPVAQALNKMIEPEDKVYITNTYCNGSWCVMYIFSWVVRLAEAEVIQDMSRASLAKNPAESALNLTWS